MEAHYANFFKVGCNSVEFVLEFGQAYDDVLEPISHTRIITSPKYVRILLKVLSESVAKYESAFGQIERPGLH
ncbi:MAG: DUF3467 domain-containing protein [Bryobacteraceae bacterium]